MSFNFSIIFGLFSLAGIAGIILYLLKRIRREKSWMPILQVITLPKTPLPKLKFVPPPLIAFLCFLTAVLALIFLASRPNLELLVEQKPGQISTHILIDLSPSTEGYSDIQNLAKKAEEAFKASKDIGEVTVSLSHNKEIFQITEPSAVSNLVIETGFQRSGFSLSESIANSSSNLDKIDQIIILSDGSPSTWKTFNWKFFDSETKILWLPASPTFEAPIKNIYIEKIRSIPSLETNKQNWEVTLRRNSTNIEAASLLHASFQGNALLDQPFSFDPEETRIELRVSINLDRLPASSKEDEWPQKAILWTIENSDDQFNADNTFYTYRKNLGKNAFLIASPEGESVLEDPSYQLASILETLGYKLRRIDFTTPNTKQPSEKFIISFLGSKTLDSSICPTKLLFQGNPRNKVARDLTVWLSPTSLDADFGSLCSCFEGFLNQEHQASPSSICADAHDRQSFIKTLVNLGAKQFGGDIGNNENAIALTYTDLALNLDLFVFTVPLRPLPSSSLKYGSFPLLVKNLVDYKNRNAKALEWPRESNYERLPQNFPDSLANIPLVESQFDPVVVDSLPPKIGKYSSLDSSAILESKKKKDPKPIIEYLAAIILLSLLIEIIYLLVFRKGSNATLQDSTLHEK